MYQFFKSDFFNFELIRILGTAPSGGCEVAEFLDAVGSIKRDDPESWYRAWHAQGVKAEEIARSAAGSGNFICARNAYLRAMTYFRASQYMFNDTKWSPDSRVVPLMERSIANFEKATQMMDGDVFKLQIPYGEHKLPAYLYMPSASRRLEGKVPVLVNSGGADSMQEELYFMYPAVGPELGYAVLTFEGPGQGIVLRRDKLHMRHDWEAVTTKVVDYLLAHAASYPELNLDQDRIAIAGASMGGYYALRGASDSRIKACVAIDPFYDMWSMAKTRMPAWYWNAWQTGWVSDRVFDAIYAFQASYDFKIRWEFTVAMWMLGTSSAAEAVRAMGKYTLRLKNGEEFLDQVRCPVFVTGAAHSLYFDPRTSTTRILEALNHLSAEQKKSWIPKEPGDGGLQAKVGAWGLVNKHTFEFLDRHFGIKRRPALANGIA